MLSVSRFAGFFSLFVLRNNVLLCCAEPLSLERLSRLALRRHLQSLNRLDDVKLLPLPGLLRDFVEQTDKISDETFTQENSVGL